MSLQTQPSSSPMHNIGKTYKVVRDFLFGALNREFLIFLFFLAVSGSFWLLMTLNEVYEKELPVAVRMVGVPKNVVMTTDISDTVYVTVKDKGFMLLSYTTSSNLRPLVLNFATYANKQSGHGTVPVSDLQRMIRQQLYASSTVVSVKADRLDFYFNYGINKEVKVALAGNIVPSESYYLSHVQFSPERVTVYASHAKLDSIDRVFTEHLNIVNFNDTVTRTVRLKAMTGVKMIPDHVKITLFPDILTEESLEVPITAVNKPDGLVIRTFPQHVRVKFTVGASMYRFIKPSDFQVVVDYKEIVARPSDKCALVLLAKPRGVNNVRLEIAQVDYLIEQ